MRTLIRPLRDAWRRPAALVLAVLTGCFALASAADARAELADRNSALTMTIRNLGVSGQTIVVEENYAGDFAPSAALAGATRDGSLSPDAIEQPVLKPSYLAEALDAGRQDIVDALNGSTAQVPFPRVGTAFAQLDSPFFTLADARRTVEPPGGIPAQIRFQYLQNEQQHAKLTAGRWPKQVTVSSENRYTVEVALSVATLERLGLSVGDSFQAVSDAPPPMTPPPVRMLITGAFVPLDPGSTFWQIEPEDLAPRLLGQGGSTPFYLAGGLLSDTEGVDLAQTSAFGRDAVTVAWHVPLDLSGLNSANAQRYQDGLETVLLDAGLSQRDPVKMSSDVDAALTRFLAEQRAGRMESAMPAVSLAVIGLIALLLAARSTIDRRDGELRLLRSRGAPLWRLAGSSIVEALLTVVPLTALGLGIAAWLPGATPAGLWREELVLPAAAVLAPTALTALRYRRSGSPAARRVRGRAQRRAQRITAQIALVVLCLLGLDEARTQGFSPTGGINMLTSSAPLLAAVLAALVVLAVGPLLLRLLVKLAARGRGAIGLLGLARTARTPGPAAVTVFVLTLVLATADIAVALHAASGHQGTSAVAAAAVRNSAVASQGDLFAAVLSGPDPLQASTADYLALLAALAVATGCLVVALAAGGDALERRSTTARLATMGLTAAQAQAITAAELLGPIALAGAAGTAAVAPLLWTVRPALAQALGGAGAHITVRTLALPLGATTVLALAAGSAAAAVARRGTTRALRLGDSMEGA
jgi:hypothetical protein